MKIQQQSCTIIKAKEIAKKSVIANIVGDNDHIGIYICMAGTFNETVENIYTDFDFHMRKNIKRRLRTVKRAIHVSDLVMKQFPVKSIQMDFLMQAENVDKIPAQFTYKDIDNICDLDSISYL